jgi:uncharacterized repeat protein (TIGR01451 family)
MSAARAQYVSIPDSNFGNWLYNNGYSSCLTGNGTVGYQLDTTCSAVLNTVSLNLSNYGFDYTGIQYFKGLDSLTVAQSFNNVSPPFPVALKYLNLSGNGSQLLSLPDSLLWLVILNALDDSLPAAFPPHMIGFDCWDCGTLLYLPVLPVTLRYLNLFNVSISGPGGLPASLPDSLRYLDCSFGVTDHIPPLPPFLDTLICSYNNIINGNMPALPSTLVYLDCSYDRLDSIPALPASLTYLDCSENNGGNSLWTSLPALPPSLVYLDCSADLDIASLPALPSTLRHLACGGNQIPTLPTLPALTYLSCYSNPLHSLPATLPSTLTYLDCSSDGLTTLPPFAAGLTYIGCTRNQITSLPALPTGLVTLYCDYNLLPALPTLPPVLQNLICGFNPLPALPALPASVQYLDCSDDQLTSLPVLPDSIGELFCDSNRLSTIQSLHNFRFLTTLSCEGNQLTSLPAMPDTLTYLNCSFNPNLGCLPVLLWPPLGIFGQDGYSNNYVQGGLYIAGTGINCIANQPQFPPSNFDIDPQSLPLCTPSSGCAFYYNISGNVHFDTAATCAGDSINPGNTLTNIKVNLLQNGQIVQQCYIDPFWGQYSFKTDSFTNYVVQIDTTALISLSTACPSSGSYTVAISTADSLSINDNFGLQCSSFDYATLSVWGRLFHPGFVRAVEVDAGNLSYLYYNANCGGAMPGTVSIIISGPAQYVNPVSGSLTPTAVSPSGDTITYSISNLDSLAENSFYINVLTDSNAVLGSSVCITGIITPATPDVNINDDTLTQCFTVSNSLDPNLKTVYPTTLTPDGGWLTYTVEFQNTGNDTAYTVVVRDTLSQYVDATTFQYIASDHKAVIQLMGNAMVFTFPRINLVDSATNPPLSTGWIQYKVKAKANLPLNTQVANTAYVYFDINPAVVTNTTINTVDTPTTPPLSIRTVSAANTIRLYPNPNNGSFTLSVAGQVTSNGALSYTITDMLGNVVAQQRITSNSQQINLPDAAEGVYTLAVKGSAPLRFTVVR